MSVQEKEENPCKKGHAYNRFGKWQETCTRCGTTHPLIIAWRQLVTIGIEMGMTKQQTPKHPYLTMLVGGGYDTLGRDRPEKCAWTMKEMKQYFKPRR